MAGSLLQRLFDSVGLSYRLGVFLLILVVIHILLVVWLMRNTKRDANESRRKRKQLSQLKKED